MYKPSFARGFYKRDTRNTSRTFGSSYLNQTHFQKRWNYYLGWIYSIFWKCGKFKPMDWATHDAYSPNTFKGSSWSLCIWTSYGKYCRKLPIFKRCAEPRVEHTALKKSCIAEAKLWRKQDRETFRNFRQAIQDLYRRAYLENRILMWLSWKQIICAWKLNEKIPRKL